MMMATGLGGLLGLTWRSYRDGILLLTFPLVYYVMVSRFVVRFERNMVPLLPFFAVGAGWLVDILASWLQNRLSRHLRLSHPLTAALALLLLLWPVTASVRFNHAISQPDTREDAGKWVQDNVEPGAKIAIEHYSIPFNHDEYWVRDVLRITDHDLEWYQSEEYEILIISDGVWDLLMEQPEVYADKLSRLDELVSGTSLVAEFQPDPPKIVTAGYPTVRIYHFAPTRIYQVD
jgi:hypothetical protein